jgi:hypothetical protein
MKYLRKLIKMKKIKINQIMKIILGIDFFLLILSVVFMNTNFFGLNFRQLHVLLGTILLLLGAFHIASHFHWRKRKK